MLNLQKLYLYGQIQTSQTGGQLYSDISPYGKYSLGKLIVYVPKFNTYPIPSAFKSCIRLGLEFLIL